LYWALNSIIRRSSIIVFAALEIIVVDTAPDEIEQMGSWALEEAKGLASSRGVGFFYLSPVDELFDVPKAM
jgi:hypothetical protein